MTTFLFSVLLALALFAILLRWLWQGRGVTTNAPGDSGPGGIEEHAVLADPELADKVSSFADLEFIERLQNRGIREMFLRERTWLALFWLRRTRQVIRRQLTISVRTARANPALTAGSEFALAFRYIQFLLAYWGATAVVRAWGPFAFRSALGRFGTVTNRIGQIAQPMLEKARTVARVG